MDLHRFRIFINEPTDYEGIVLAALKERDYEVSTGPPSAEGDSKLSEDEMIEKGMGAHALIGSSRESYGRRLMQSLPDLLTISKFGRGVEKIDIAAANELGVLVSNTPVNYDSVAEAAVCYILVLAKNIRVKDTNVRRGLWRTTGYSSMATVDVKGKTAGIIGIGRIGMRVAKLLVPFGVRVLAYDPYVKREQAELVGAELTDLETLLRQSDFVTVHAVATHETHKMMAEKQFRMMKPTSFFINTARGVIVDEQALAQALSEGWIAGAALDVMDPEPPSPHNALLSPELEDRVWLSPHACAFTPGTLRRMNQTQLKNCLDALDGKLPEYALNPEAYSKFLERYKRITSS